MGLDDTHARTKLGQWQAKARDFTKQTAIKRDSAREFIGTTDGKQPRGIKQDVSSAQATTKTSTKTRTSVTTGITKPNEFEFVKNDIHKEDIPAVTNDLQKVETSHLERLEKHAKNMRGNFYGNAGDAYYSPQDNRIYLDINLVDERSKVLGFNTDITALLHESGHWLDFNMLGNGQTVRSQLPELRKYLEKDTINYVNNCQQFFNFSPKNFYFFSEPTRVD